VRRERLEQCGARSKRTWVGIFTIAHRDQYPPRSMSANHSVDYGAVSINLRFTTRSRGSLDVMLQVNPSSEVPDIGYGNDSENTPDFCSIT
jgi:hypothetical protein